MNNNPVVNTDVLGDSIRRTTAFNNSSTALMSYLTWSRTTQGKDFLRDYGAGGKNEHISVVFDVGNIKDKSVGGLTNTTFINKDGIEMPITEIYSGSPEGSIPDQIRQAADGKSTDGSFVRVTMLMAKSSFS